MLCPQTSTVSLQEHPEILALLQDDDLRQELQDRPAEVLGRYGLHLEAKDIPRVVQLPRVSDFSDRAAIGPRWMGLI